MSSCYLCGKPPHREMCSGDDIMAHAAVIASWRFLEKKQRALDEIEKKAVEAGFECVRDGLELRITG